MDTDVIVDLLGGAPDAFRLRLLGGILHAARTCLNAEEVSLLLLDEAAAELAFAYTDSDQGTDRALAGHRIPVASSLSGRAVRSGVVEVGSPELMDVPVGARSYRLGEKGSIPSVVLAAPIHHGGGVGGVLVGVNFLAGQWFTRRDQTVAAAMARLLGAVLWPDDAPAKQSALT